MAKKESNILSKRLIHSYLSSIISISLVLFSVGVAGLVAVNAGAVSDYFRENMKVSAVLNLENSEEEAALFVEELQHEVYVKSIEIISREQGINEMKEILGEDFLSVFETSPIPVSLEIQLTAPYIHTDSLKVVKERIEKLPMVEEVVYQESLVELLNANLQKIGLILAVFIALLLFISFVLINNTVRLNVFSKRFTIHTMRLVGATKGFITRPFVGHAFFQGLLSGLIAVLELVGVLYLIRNEFGYLFQIFSFELLLYLLIGIIALGVVICIVSTIFVVRKLVSLTTDELYY